jgi:hypothetical protein
MEPLMRRIPRIVLLAGLVVLAPALSGCENFDMDKLDVFGLNEKKKLPGDRKPVFPEGVPGVTQGIPQEYIKGNQPPADAAQAAPAGQVVSAPAADAAKNTAAAAPAEEPKPKPRKPRVTKQKLIPDQTPRPAAQQPADSQQPAPWPAQNQQQPPQQSSTAPNTAPWPSSPAPGTFSR